MCNRNVPIRITNVLGGHWREICLWVSYFERGKKEEALDMDVLRTDLYHFKITEKGAYCDGKKHDFTIGNWQCCIYYVHRNV